MDIINFPDKLSEFMDVQKQIYEEICSQSINKNNQWSQVHNFIHDTKYHLKSKYKLNEKEADKIMLKYFNY